MSAAMAFSSLLVQEDLRLEHELGVIRHLVLLAEVDLVGFLTENMKTINIRKSKKAETKL